MTQEAAAAARLVGRTHPRHAREKNNNNMAGGNKFNPFMSCRDAALKLTSRWAFCRHDGTSLVVLVTQSMFYTHPHSTWRRTVSGKMRNKTPCPWTTWPPCWSTFINNVSFSFLSECRACETPVAVSRCPHHGNVVSSLTVKTVDSCVHLIPVCQPD